MNSLKLSLQIIANSSKTRDPSNLIKNFALRSHSATTHAAKIIQIRNTWRRRFSEWFNAFVSQRAIATGATRLFNERRRINCLQYWRTRVAGKRARKAIRTAIRSSAGGADESHKPEGKWSCGVTAKVLNLRRNVWLSYETVVENLLFFVNYNMSDSLFKRRLSTVWEASFSNKNFWNRYVSYFWLPENIKQIQLRMSAWLDMFYIYFCFSKNFYFIKVRWVTFLPVSLSIGVFSLYFDYKRNTCFFVFIKRPFR